MSTFDPLTKAKKLAEQATQTALDIKEHAAIRAGEIREKTASRVEEATTLATGFREQTTATLNDLKDRLAAKITDMTGVAFTAVKEMVDDLNRHLPALREAGYVVSEVSIEVGLPPKIVASFDCSREISEERLEAIVEEHKEAKVTVILLRAFHAARRFQDGIKIVGMKPQGIALEMGLIPSVVVKFA
jgi:hypothetical protein